MPKIKTHKGLAKRVKISKTGKVIMRKAGSSHLMAGKSSKRKRQLKRAKAMYSAFARKARIALTSK